VNGHQKMETNEQHNTKRIDLHAAGFELGAGG
jgi:hypothetical protein